MDYNMNIQNYNNSLVPEFIYDDRRCCSKIVILFKIIGCIFYTMTLPTCDKAEIYIVMITAMFLSTLNDMRIISHFTNVIGYPNNQTIPDLTLQDTYWNYYEVDSVKQAFTTHVLRQITCDQTFSY
jgi:hypothetical protein